MGKYFDRIMFTLSSGLDKVAFEEALIGASFAGDIEKVKSLLKSGKDVNFTYTNSIYSAIDSFTGTPLSQAVGKGHIEVLKLLIEAGANVNAVSDGYTYLLEASGINGYTEVVERLLKAGANPNLGINLQGETALFLASMWGHSEIVKLLLEAGANVDTADCHSRTPLWMASNHGHSEIVKLLLDAGADLDAADEDGITSLADASRYEQSEMIELLINAGANSNILNSQKSDADKSKNKTVKKQSGSDFAFSFKDVRSNPNDDGEVILNLWYVTDLIVISSLRAKAYVASGTDADKQSFLQKRASRDFKDTPEFPVPEDLKANVMDVDGTSIGDACTHATLEIMGGYPALFRELLLSIPQEDDYYFDPAQAMLCITALVEDEEGNLSVRVR